MSRTQAYKTKSYTSLAFGVMLFCGALAYGGIAEADSPPTHIPGTDIYCTHNPLQQGFLTGAGGAGAGALVGGPYGAYAGGLLGVGVGTGTSGCQQVIQGNAVPEGTGKARAEARYRCQHSLPLSSDTYRCK